MISIASYVSERDTTYWRIIFESLLKESVLSGVLGLKNKDVLNLYYGLKTQYEDISYYWLQLGIAEQKSNDFSKALNHLKQAHQIRPKAYQIQHAIARNYLRHANAEKDKLVAVELFNLGETMMLQLINSKEGYKEKAKNYSIHCYAHEKIKFMTRNPEMVNPKICQDLKKYIDKMNGERSDYYRGVVKEFVDMLKKYHLENILSMKLGDVYFEAWAQNVNSSVADDEDVLTESV